MRASDRRFNRLSSRSVARGVARVIALLGCLLASLTLLAPAAGAHAELLQSSPRAGATVGGEFHQIALQFGGLDEVAPQRVRLIDPGGAEIPSEIARNGQRIVIPIDPLNEPGTYTVIYEVNGADGDQSSGNFSFRYSADAPDPLALTIGQGNDDGFDVVSFGLLLVAAGLLGFLVHRFSQAWREHRAAAG